MSRAEPTVRIFECSDRHRRFVLEAAMDELVAYVRRAAGNDKADGLREDLEADGKARIDGEFFWFEYERADP